MQLPCCGEFVDQTFFGPLFNPLNAKLNPICHLLALLGAHHILHISRIRVNCVFVSVMCVQIMLDQM